MSEAVCWTVKVSLETDVEVRSYLARGGMKKNGLSLFVEDAVKWRLFDLTLSEARTSFDDLSPNEMVPLIEDAVADARKH